MIRKVSYKNFKCLDGQSFDLKDVNIFSGYNGRGKSSVMQAVLMLTQSLRDKHNLIKLHLNGTQVMLGDYNEILTSKDNIEVGFDFELDEELVKKVSLRYEPTEDYMVGQIKELRINGVDFFDTAGKMDEKPSKKSIKELNRPLPQSLINEFSNVHFISANRQGPVRFVERKEIPDFHNVGKDGNNTINTITTYVDQIPAVMNIKKNDDRQRSLKESVSEWIDYIMNDGVVKVKGEDQKEESSVLSLGFSFKNTKRIFNSYNVGFGYSYILSVIVEALIAKKGSILIVENPEAHLHPEAQLRLTLLLSKLADRGVQVFVETHSEHIVNGFRIAALDDKCDLTNEQLAIFFFDKDFSIKRLKVHSNGRIPEWPKRFFDQFEDEMVKIIELGAGK